MTTEQKIEIATTLVKKSIEISETTNHQVFCDYSPHVDWVDIAIHRGGWRKGKSGTNYIVSLDDSNAEEEFDNVMAILDKLQQDAEK